MPVSAAGDGAGRAWLSLHVLDVTVGLPAAGVAVTLRRLDADGGGEQLASVTTNADGRTDAPLLEGDALAPGTYELAFALGDHFAASTGSGDRYLDVVPVRFGIGTDPGHVHVALLATPWSYTTYRGS
ncbi:hydroxyisourate hydrolase [Aquihabitans sp. G128]|uniref:hydroxyisourate hydrolase n=1 Tax=Aquihabitans sp. G128 TaxID=2849779 RepID=UPI001C219DB0|nr:hydroxyisourate hydrolase [Aquihabitans sp. G128]QXC61062.1 hydroxyisourate hydrolase [Aquihabitans sp. G128]